MNEERKNTYIGVLSPCSPPLSGMVVVDCSGHVNVGTQCRVGMDVGL